MFRITFLVLCLSAVSISAFASSDGAYLDAPYKGRHLMTKSIAPQFSLAFFQPTKSDTLSLVAKQSPVRSQGHRGTCSIFSATAMLESMMIIKKNAPTTINLSEEWLEYVVNRNSSEDGSTAYSNFGVFARYGSVNENLMPYIGEEWDDATQGLAKERCGDIPLNLQKGCMIAHRDPRLLTATDAQLLTPKSPLYDPEFQKARAAAISFQSKYMTGLSKQFRIYNVDEAKALLRSGIPVVLEVDFFYGAWNHREGEEHGLTRNMDHWAKGIVGYPEKDSLDEKISLENPAGHSVLVVGYDDNVEVTTQSQMKDGSVKEFTHRGVYYFKNSWGTDNFGTETLIDGKIVKGYGMITADYAESKYGSFFKLPLN